MSRRKEEPIAVSIAEAKRMITPGKTIRATVVRDGGNVRQGTMRVEKTDKVKCVCRWITGAGMFMESFLWDDIAKMLSGMVIEA